MFLIPLAQGGGVLRAEEQAADSGNTLHGRWK
jgi:hypothetical protein